MAAKVVATALGKPESSDTRLHVFALLGEVLYFRVAQPVVLRRMGWKAIDDAERAAIKRVVLSHVEDILLAERNKCNAEVFPSCSLSLSSPCRDARAAAIRRWICFVVMDCGVRDPAMW